MFHLKQKYMSPVKGILKQKRCGGFAFLERKREELDDA